MIRDVTLADADRIAEIYNYYIRETIVTFEYDPVTGEDIKERIKKVTDKNFPYFVYEQEGRVVG